MFNLKSLYFFIYYTFYSYMTIIYNFDFYLNKKSCLYIFLKIILQLYKSIYIIFFYLY